MITKKDLHQKIQNSMRYSTSRTAEKLNFTELTRDIELYVNQRVIDELEKTVKSEIHTGNHDFVWAVRSELIEDRIVELGRDKLKQN